ncbi:alpha/beta fold hydrolase [Mycolicibacterium baixiangningiae]|uniref:alpha/beta fold hydrolase n=1 Tax=Mycolicibacterium baixiangningiae TaxID=2761578 RepID=UPI0018688992|nr:alpha/beta fold hydrolase [Mycolicibacterium baixiangningiae]
MSLTGHSSFDLGDVRLLSGETLPNAQLAYKTYGRLNAAGDNVVVLPTFFTGTHRRNEGFFGPGRAIDPEHHFVVSINMFGNGLSTSPSHAAPGQQGAWFPEVTLYDNVQCQYRLLFDHLGVQRIALVAGWSMAGCQAYHWAALYPDLVDAIIPFCASARTSPHNFVFLEGVKAALLADRCWDGDGGMPPPIRGLKAFARVYAGWAYSQTFFRDGHYRKLGYESIEDLLVDWENDHVEHWNAHDLLAKIWSWQRNDISANPLYGGDFRSALRAISARAIVIPCTQDLYFPPEDNRLEVEEMPNAELRPYDSPFGHCVANPGNDAEFEEFLDAAIHDVLQPNDYT